MQLDLFQFINNLFDKKVNIDSRNPFKETYMTIKFLSLYPGTFTIANLANRLSRKIPIWATNCFLFYTVPKQKPPRIHYPKGEEKENDSLPPEATNKICQRFCCSAEHAKQILKILKKDSPDILLSLGVDQNGGKNSGKKNSRFSKQKFGS